MSRFSCNLMLPPPALYSGLEYHRQLHGDADAGRAAEDLSGEHPGASLLPLRQPVGLLQEEEQVRLVSYVQYGMFLNVVEYQEPFWRCLCFLAGV